MKKKKKSGTFYIKNTYTSADKKQKKLLVNSVIAKLITQAK